MADCFDPADLRADLMFVSDHSVVVRDSEVPRDFQIRLTHPGWPVPFMLHVTVDPDRGPIASGITNYRLGRSHAERTDVPTYKELDRLLSATVTVTDILWRMTAEAAGVQHRHRIEQAMVDRGELDQLSRAEISEIGKQTEVEARRVADDAMKDTAPRRRRIVSRQHLAEVAAAYRDALDQGLPPTKHVAERFHASHSTAARWVGMARQSGELGPATGPRPGEGRA